MGSGRVSHQNVESPCPLCGGAGRGVTSQFEGYCRGWTTSIRECVSCDISYSARRDIPDSLYEGIYRHAETIPGYERYGRYAGIIGEQADPLAWLAAQEAPYATVLKHVEALGPDVTVLELGCGLGYLTHALRRRGIDAIGVDLSSEAVNAARERFGDLEAFMTPEELTTRRPSGFDLVIGLEIIEHVTDPIEFVESALEHVGPAGAVLFTTPNRDVLPVDVLWDSDLPPVHLTWFGAESMRMIAATLDLAVDFIDAAESADLPDASARNLSTGALLTADGSPAGLSRWWRWRAFRSLESRLLRVQGTPRFGRQRLVGLPRVEDPECRGTTLGVLFRRGAA